VQGHYVHSKLGNIMLVATEVHVVLRSFVVLTKMLDKNKNKNKKGLV
jgi:hypothetical protein